MANRQEVQLPIKQSGQTDSSSSSDEDESDADGGDLSLINAAQKVINIA